MDKIIVISEHAKKGFDETIFGEKDTDKQFKVSKPVEVVHFPVKNVTPAELDLNLEFDFNFLCVCQWGPRKNLEQTIVNFIEEFKNEEVGLVIKTNTVADSIIDREMCEKRLKNILNNFPDKKCKVYLLHGYMSEEELFALYKNPKIKAIVSTTHGEGYGLPLFEASYNELPIIATDWSGHLDFLKVTEEDGTEKKMFAKVDFQLGPIAKEHVWQGILEEGTSWAYPSATSFKNRMREVFKDYPRFKSWAKKLAVYNKNKFTEKAVYDKFCSVLTDVDDSFAKNVLEAINEK